MKRHHTWRTLEGNLYHDAENNSWHLGGALSQREGRVMKDLRTGRYLFFVRYGKETWKFQGEALNPEDALDEIRAYVTEVFQCHRCYMTERAGLAILCDLGYAYCEKCATTLSSPFPNPNGKYHAVWGGASEFYSGLETGDRVLVDPRGKAGMTVFVQSLDNPGAWMAVYNDKYFLLHDIVEVEG
jgi:hypothetical protein